MAEVFAACGFGWRKLQIGIAQEIVEKCRNTAPLRCEASVLVETLAAAREMRDEGVDEHVGGAGVEGEDWVCLGRSRENRNVGRAAQIERNATQFRMTIEDVVRVRG